MFEYGLFLIPLLIGGYALWAVWDIDRHRRKIEREIHEIRFGVAKTIEQQRKESEHEL